MNYYMIIEDELEKTFLPKKAATYALIQSFERLKMYKKAEKVANCGTDLEFRIPPNATEAKLHYANFCKERLCPCCAWRRSMKIFGQISQVMDKIENQYQYIFLTLTIRNCSGKNLTKEINRLQEGFRALTRNAKIKKAFKGTFRALEVTHHPEYLKEVEYHPHLHIIVAVNPSYFTSRDYISQPELIRIWRECAKLDYDPSVRIQKVVEQKNKNRDEISIKGAVCELSKYTIKASEINFGSFAEIDRRVLTYTEALSGRRLCAFTGIFKKTAAELKLDDITDGDLVLTNNKIRYDVGTMIIRYQWQAGIGYTHKYTKVLEENYASQDPGD